MANKEETETSLDEEMKLKILIMKIIASIIKKKK